jgi:hypothetical protein
VEPARGVMREELTERGGAQLDGMAARAAGPGQELLAEVQVADDEDVRGPGHGLSPLHGSGQRDKSAREGRRDIFMGA